ncbi:hypothetical protein E4U24_000192 [Claviceps purpurea]|nr:hypothetical protein E4U24_000192 [Claviceps purpurea]
MRPLLCSIVPNKKSLGTALQVILHSMNHQKSMAMEDPHQNQATLAIVATFYKTST